MVQTTPNYGLQQPQGNDTVDLVDLITNNTNIIDTQMKANATAAAAAQTSANNAQTTASAAQSTANQALSAAENISPATPNQAGIVLVSAPSASGQDPVAVATTDPVYENAARKDVAQIFTAQQTWAATAIMAALQAATSSNNYGSIQLQFQRSYWNNGAATTGTSYWQYDNTGNLNWYNESGTAIFSVDQNGDLTANGTIKSNGNSVLTTLTGVTSVNGQTGAVTIVDPVTTSIIFG
ncbi:hypothetical protein NZD89_09365 [Alicyclobacillus fastidiosus]|uniref:Uncharacterized protein n=1 Tax=Alicyclobacillus fastidiosus TaxID=392011 RepID=A0ABY6ZNQ1_9BACL|nr:hypothetical protein [Alicyclobacillus fastidiosus]WAH43565.1 hypothetical protein NZD89_09365 [Alicyclobacillus fastidiosus]GMA59743.1 hypothetical protein GCM10025859_01830 [Alicyclobacillus fastidiosus]